MAKETSRVPAQFSTVQLWTHVPTVVPVRVPLTSLAGEDGGVLLPFTRWPKQPSGGPTALQIWWVLARLGRGAG